MNLQSELLRRRERVLTGDAARLSAPFLVLGGGKRLFAADGADFARLDLVDQATYANGIQKLCYDVVR